MIQLYLLTFNCARELVDPQSLAPSFFDALPQDAPTPHLIALSLQEIAPIAYSFLGGSYLKPYFDRLTTAVQLAAHLRGHGPLVHVATRSLGMTGLMIFASDKLAQRIQHLQSAGAGVGFSNMGNKGAVAMRLGIACPDSHETLGLTFSAAHLAPAESSVDARNKDWEHLVRNLVFLHGDDSPYSFTDEELPRDASETQPADHHGLFAEGSHVFFYGDLNYRTHDTSPDEDAHKTFPRRSASQDSKAHFSHLLKDDQLTREKTANRTLHHFQELPITFPPTYKYAVSKGKRSGAAHRALTVEEQDWQWSKHRYPSWCDRILYLPSHASSTLEPQIYMALPIQPTSDHRPVALSIRVDDKPLAHGEDHVRSRPPFPINPQWRARRDAARRWEVIVGVLSYLALTGKGNAILMTVFGALMGGLWLASWFAR